MKKISITVVFSVLVLSGVAQTRFWVASLPGLWSNSANWSATSNGVGGASVPTVGNAVVFDGAGSKNGNCTLDVSPTIAGLTFSAYTGIVDLASNTLTTTGSNTFTSGTINNSLPASGSLALNNTTLATTFKGTLINANVTGTTGSLLFSGSTFGGTVNIIKANNTGDTGLGGNTFNGAVTLSNNSTSTLLLGNTTKDIFNGTLSININNTGAISIAAGGAVAHQLNDNISITYNSTGNVNFGQSNGPSTLAAGKTISVSSPGAGGSGNLILNHFTTSATAQSITLTGNSTAILTIGPSSTFGGALTASSPGFQLISSTFSGTTTLTKTGSVTDNITGGNTFTSATFNNTGAGEFNLANTNPDTFNGNTILNNTGTSRMELGVNAAGIVCNGNLTVNHSGSTNNLNTIFCRNAGSTATINGNLILNETNTDPTSAIIVPLNGAIAVNGNITVSSTSGKGILFGGDQTTSVGTTTLANGFTVKDGGAGTFSAGILQFQNFQQIGPTAQAVTITGTSSLLLAANSTFNGNVNFLAPQVYLNGTTYNGTATIEKNGAVDNNGAGGNIFNSTATITNSGSGYLLTGNTNADQFRGTTTFNNTGTYRFYFAHAHAGQTTSFTGDLTLNSNKSGGADGWSFFYNEGANTAVSFGGNVTLNVAGSVQSNCRFQNAAGTTATYAGVLTVNNTNSNAATNLYLVTGGSTTYNGNIVVNNTASADAMYFGFYTTSTVSLASGKTIAIGASGFSIGSLTLTNFTAPTAQTLTTFSGTASLVLGLGSNFGGAVTFIAPQIFLNGSTFGASAYIEKNGATDNNSIGGNTFNASVSLVDSGSGYLLMGNSASDTFNGDLTILNTGLNWIYMAHNAGGTLFNGNITVNNTTGNGIVFSNGGSGSGTLASGKTIMIGGTGFSTGQLIFKRFTQNGAAPVNLIFTGTAVFRPGPSASFGGNVNVMAPQVYLDGGTFNGTATIEKNGATDNAGAGGNIFNATTSITDSGSGNLVFANVSPDTFNADVTFSNSGSNWIFLAHNVPGTVFNGNIIFNCTAGLGIILSNNTTGFSSQAAGKSISIGSSGFSTGELRIRRFTQNGTSPVNLALTGVAILRPGTGTTFNGNVTASSPQVYLDGATYNGTASIEKNGAGDNQGLGGNVFNNTTTWIDSGSGYLLSANTSPDIFNGDLTITNTGSNRIYLAWNAAGNQFNGNIIVNAPSGTGVYFSDQPAGSSILASGKSISIGAQNFLAGELRLARFTQVGSGTLQTLLLGGASALRVGPSSAFGSDVSFIAPQVILDGCTYSGVSYLEKNGAPGSTGIGNNTFSTTTTLVNSGSGVFRTNGGNTFNGTTTLTNSGSADLLLELATGNTYNGDLVINNTGSSNVRMDFLGTTAFNGNISVSCTGGLGIVFGESATATSTLASGKSIVTGAPGYTTGYLMLEHFTQLGAGAQSLTLTGNSALYIGPSSTFNGNVNFKAPQVFLNGCTYNGVTLIEKTGATNNDSAGSNIFNGVTTLTNSGSGFLRLARTSLDQFNNDLTLTNSGIAQIFMSDLVAGSLYNGNIAVNSILGGGIFFGNSGGSSLLAAGKNIHVGASGFTIGELRLQAFTQLGATSQIIALTGTSDLRVGPASTFNGNIDFRAPQLLLDGALYNGTAYLEKNGAGNNTGLGNNTFASTATIVSSSSGFLRTNGNNTFNGVTSFTNSGSADVLFELVSGSTYNGDVTFSNTGSSNIRSGFTGTTFYNGNINVSSLTATGIAFGENPGALTLASGKTIAVVAPGFSAGTLSILRMTQVGSTAQTITLSGSGNFASGTATTWNGNLTVTAPAILLNGSTFNGTNSFTKNGTSVDVSVGGNIFNGSSTFTNTNSGTFRFANATGDAFNGNATFVQTAGLIQPAYNVASSSNGDILVGGNTVVIFSQGTGSLTLSGGTAQAIGKMGAASPSFVRLIVNKTAGVVSLNTDINITTSGTFTAGVINSTATNFVNFGNGATTSGASSASYVDGPVRKTGKDVFIFPVGNAGIFRTIAITAPLLTTDAFTAQYFKASQAFGGASTFAPTLFTVSSCEYWILNRTTGTSNVNVTLSWNSPDCTGSYITDITKLRVARWNLSSWVDHGNGGTTGNTITGTVTTSAPVTSFSPFTLGSTTPANTLPIELVDFTATAVEGNVQLNWITASELNNDYFNAERSTDGVEFQSLAEIKGAGTTSLESHYAYLDVNPGNVVLYYRLKQTDFNGNTTFSSIVKISPGEIEKLSAWPNPVQAGKFVTLNYSGYYQVFSSTGLLVGKTSKTNTIDTGSLPTGVYILKAETGLNIRLIVQ